MKIYKRYLDPKDYDWNETTLEECLEHTEGTGYWKPNSVEEILTIGLIVRTPFAEWKMEDRNE